MHTTFLLTRPSRGATEENGLCPDCYRISTHTPLAGRDLTQLSVWLMPSEFLLTRPSRGATQITLPPGHTWKFLLTRPSRGATYFMEIHEGTFSISTHTPLAGRDQIIAACADGTYNFYSHAPRGARPIPSQCPCKYCRFLLTRPSRGATRRCSGKDRRENFYSHAPRGARRVR